MERIKTSCDGCAVCCGAQVFVSEGGRVLKIEGDPDHPETKGHMCIKGLAGMELLYNDMRVNYPLKRTDKNSEKWERISWDEALSLISNRLTEIREKYGPESIVVAHGSWSHDHVGISTFFAAALGTPNVMGMDYICFGPMALACHADMGIPTALGFKSFFVSFAIQCLGIFSRLRRDP
ncbi:MAG: molybdopterin-dependent oxidoreductase [Candidatus Hadarchaeum sp.]|uniref:molybdopterin-dependent oxidoreductase n=1 Tax=Candidatus Hadarchaeum sp. TaxID=2883567 RepID=UPI003D0CDF10